MVLHHLIDFVARPLGLSFVVGLRHLVGRLVGLARQSLKIIDLLRRELPLERIHVFVEVFGMVLRDELRSLADNSSVEIALVRIGQNGILGVKRIVTRIDLLTRRDRLRSIDEFPVRRDYVTARDVVRRDFLVECVVLRLLVAHRLLGRSQSSVVNDYASKLRNTLA